MVLVWYLILQKSYTMYCAAEEGYRLRSMQLEEKQTWSVAGAQQGWFKIQSTKIEVVAGIHNVMDIGYVLVDYVTICNAS